MIDITLDTHINISGLNDKWKKGLSGLVSIENESKDQAERELLWGAKTLPDKISLASNGDGEFDELVLPRGFWPTLKNILEQNNHDYRLHDNMVGEKPWWVPAKGTTGHSFIENQEYAFIKMIEGHSGRVIAAPGKGKTVMGLAFLDYLSLSGIIIVEKTHIAKQWQDRAKEHFGIETGIIGDGEWDEKQITIATVQTLWSRRRELDEKYWWGQWEAVMLDEQHHIPAETFINIIQRFPARYRIGLSATVGKSEAKKKISELVFGPILFNDSNMALNPTVKIEKTKFIFDFHPTHTVVVNGKKKVKRNNYQKMISELCNDAKRNFLVATTVSDHFNYANLIISRRLKHLDQIKELVIHQGVFSEEQCLTLTGKESTERRLEIYELVEKLGPCCVFSTIADEALDIPRLDALHMAFPAKNDETIYQQIGRVCRKHDNKNNPVIIDYVDENVGVLYSQYKHRLRKVYQSKKFEILHEENDNSKVLAI